jgi:MGT family glycosyltransferase
MKKILFANVPADGHFNPLTGLALHLKEQGHDVRWYSGSVHHEKIKKMGIPLYPFNQALDITPEKLDQIFPERERHKSQIAKLNFDLIHLFVLRSTEYLADIEAIHADFPFDLLITDVAFTGSPLVKGRLKKPVIAVGVVPLLETSKDLAPYGLGLAPSNTFWGRQKQNFLRFVADNVLFPKPRRVMKKIMEEHGVPVPDGNFFDMAARSASLLLQSGTPGFEYNRSDLNPNVRFIGPLLPRLKKTASPYQIPEDKKMKYRRVVLVTQGTVEKDPEKLIIPTLEAFKDSHLLVIVTTAGFQTQELRACYPQENIIIEDFIPFGEVMPQADVYVTNGGYGGVLLSIQHQLPMVVAGVHEGKNEINARVGYFELGLDLKTEKPSPQQIRAGVEEVLTHYKYRENVERLSEEFGQYDPAVFCERYVNHLLRGNDRMAEVAPVAAEPVLS